MRWITLGLAFIILYLAFSCSIPLSGSKDDQDMAFVWRHVCEISQYDCSELDVPEFRWTPQLDSHGLRGAYPLGNRFWIQDDLPYSRQLLIMFHETLHYVQYHNEVPITKSNVIRCISEREALDFTNQFADEIGVPELKRSVDDWKKKYRC